MYYRPRTFEHDNPDILQLAMIASLQSLQAQGADRYVDWYPPVFGGDHAAVRILTINESDYEDVEEHHSIIEILKGLDPRVFAQIPESYVVLLSKN